jgi:molybdopterin adenylyltransferase
MRLEGTRNTPFAALSRGVCGIRGHSLILNVPGSPKGAVESLEAVIEIIPHALQLLIGDTKHM